MTRLINHGPTVLVSARHDGVDDVMAAAWCCALDYTPPKLTVVLACALIREPRNQEAYDLFIGEVVGAWADTRVFENGHWQFESAAPALRSLHYIAGGHFYAIGAALDANREGVG